MVNVPRTHTYLSDCMFPCPFLVVGAPPTSHSPYGSYPGAGAAAPHASSSGAPPPGHAAAAAAPDYSSYYGQHPAQHQGAAASHDPSAFTVIVYDIACCFLLRKGDVAEMVRSLSQRDNPLSNSTHSVTRLCFKLHFVTPCASAAATKMALCHLFEYIAFIARKL